MSRPRAISACLCGLACRYDGAALPPQRRPDLDADTCWIPVCPEQLGGLSTPRSPATFRGGDGGDLLDGTARLIDAEGRDVSAAFLRGAQETLLLCLCLGVEEVLLKANSPSCGLSQVHDQDGLREGRGVTAALISRHGLRVREF